MQVAGWVMRGRCLSRQPALRTSVLTLDLRSSTSPQSLFSGENAKEEVRKCSLPQALTSRLLGGGAGGESLDVTVACSDCKTQKELLKQNSDV